MVKRKFGLELESFGLTGKQISDIVGTVSGGRFVDNLHTHYGDTFFDGKTWQGMRDGSIGNTGYLPDGTSVRPKSAGMYPASWSSPGTHEVVSPVLKGGKGMKDALKVVRGLNKAGAQVDISTGLHVTFGLDNARWQRMGPKKRAKTLKRLVDSYNWFGPGINSIVAPSRRGGQWAAFNDLYDSLTSKYSAVNLSKFASGGVVEFRQHQGTLDPKKVRNWVNLLDKLLNFSTNEEFKNIDFIGSSNSIGSNTNFMEIKLQTQILFRIFKVNHFRTLFI